jgi:hypothetical protein
MTNTTGETTMKFEIKHRWTGTVIFTAEIEADGDTAISVKLGLAVRAALKAKADLRGADLRGADLSGAPVIADIHAKVYAAASQPGALDMTADGTAARRTAARDGWSRLAGQRRHWPWKPRSGRPPPPWLSTWPAIPLGGKMSACRTSTATTQPLWPTWRAWPGWQHDQHRHDLYRPRQARR